VHWLAAGLALLALSAGAASRPVRWTLFGAVAASATILGFLGSLRVYPPLKALFALALATAGILLLRWLMPFTPGSRGRLPVLLAGLALTLFALFGPAGGLF
jgi:hypothetical protein